MTAFKGSREAFAAAITDLAAENDKIMFVSPDSVGAMRCKGFAADFPERYIEVGIAEQNSVNVAAGLASTGLIPFVGTYAGFLTMRACEQMRTFVAYPNLNVKFVGINSGLMGGEREGVTHQFYEDLGILSNIPNFKLYVPADPGQTYHAVKLAAKVNGPVYIRAGSGREDDVYDRETPFSETGIRVVKEYGNEVLIMSTGFVLDRVIEAAELLKQQGVNVTVADVNILYGDDPSEIIKVIKSAKKILTVEDHNANGGLGAYISKLVVENDPKYVKRLALTTFGESGTAIDLADSYGYSPENIAKLAAEY